MPPGKRRSGLALAPNETVDDQNDDRSDHRADEPRLLAGFIPADRLSKIGRDERAGDAEQDGDDEAARVLARHQQLGDDAGYEADQYRPDDPMVLPSSFAPWRRHLYDRRGWASSPGQSADRRRDLVTRRIGARRGCPAIRRDARR